MNTCIRNGPIWHVWALMNELLRELLVLDHRSGFFTCCLLDTLVKMGPGPPASMLNPSMMGMTEKHHQRVVSPDTSKQREAN